jgi:hypothetical protein
MNIEIHLEAIVAAESYSRHHCHLVQQGKVSWEDSEIQE